LLDANVVIQAGEHTIPVRPGKLVRIPPVEEVNDYNMAQTNFHYYKDGAWVTFSERQLQYIDYSRRLFVIHVTPNALHPTVTTIKDVKRGSKWF